MQNIGGENAGDQFYRYKMPKLIAKIEGRGNGIKTNVVNNVDIAKALERPPEYVLKFFGCELGALINYDSKTGTSIVNGAHDAKRLSELLNVFIKKYVQCYDCGNPETVIKIKKDFISLKCKACGAVSSVDPRHKLNTYILKNPPKNELKKEERQIKQKEEERMRDAREFEEREKKEKKKEKKEKKEKAEKKDKKKKKEEAGNDDGGENGEEDNDDQDEDDDDGVVWMTDTSEAAMRKRAEEQLSAATAAMVTQGNIEAEREAAQRKAEKEAAKKAEEERLAAEEAERVSKLLSLDKKIDMDKARSAIEYLLQQGDRDALVEYWKMMLMEGGLVVKMRVLFEILLGDGSRGTVEEVMDKEQAVFTRVSSDPQHQLAQLLALEYFLGEVAPERVKEVVLALKKMYDLDVVDEDIIIAWHQRIDAGKSLGVSSAAAQRVRKLASPLITWLEENGSEDDSDEEDD